MRLAMSLILALALASALALQLLPGAASAQAAPAAPGAPTAAASAFSASAFSASAYAASANAASAGLRPVPLAPAGVFDLSPSARLLVDDGGDFPAAGAAALHAWLAAHRSIDALPSSGGAYWLVVSVRNDSAIADWVLYPNTTMIDRIETRVYSDGGAGGGSVSAPVFTGFRAAHPYMLHYASDLRLQPGGSYRLVLRLSSPYFVRTPLFAMRTEAAFRRLVARENVIVIASLGALAALALYNFFIFTLTRRSAYLYYSLYVVCSALGWALPFNVFADLFDWRQVELHYLPFFLLPVFSTLFYVRFLELPTLAPRLAALSRINIVLPLLLLPTSFLALGVAHKLATLVIAFYMVLALVSGVVAWRRGFQPARYFVLAFIGVLAPALLMVPSNLGLLPPMEVNMPLLVLVGGTVDALLLAFALADGIRLMGDQLETKVAARTDELLRTNAALTVAKDHAEVVSRHRIDFLSAMSHDIRTPMAGIIGMLKLGLRDDSVRGRTAEYLRIALRNGESLLVILNDILDYSKIDAGKLTLESTAFDLPRLTADATAILQGQAEAKGLLLRAAFEDDLPRYVLGDPTRLRQILINLLGNAIKFTEHGEVLLSVRADASDRVEGAAMALVLSVHDTGPGIPAEVQQRLFQKFEQGDYSTTRRYGGTGLGLAICKELAALMGGSISVVSTLGVGSRFDVILPLLPAALPSAAQGEAGAAACMAAPAPHARRLRILCAEDVYTNQLIIGALLEAMGHAVVIVENGSAALRALCDDDFDLVLMDGRMPLMDGAQATLQIRAGDGGDGRQVRNRRIPIIALTANASEADCQRYLAAGMDAFLSKPVDEAALHAAIAAVIDSGGDGGGDAVQGEPAEASAGASVAGTAPAAPVVILPLQGLGAAQMGRIAAAFLAEAPRRLAATTAALAAGRQDAAADALHALKGSAGYLSSPRLRQLAGQLELRALAGQLHAGDADMAALAGAVDEAVAGVRATAAIAPIL